MGVNKMKSKLILVSLFFLLGVVSCNGGIESMQSVQSINVPTDRNDSSVVFDSLFKKNRYVILETTAESLIRKVGKVAVYKGDIYILDTREKQLLIFDKEGKFKHKISHMGQGPEEYLSLTDFTIKEDQLILLDRVGAKLLFYSMDDSLASIQRIEKAQSVFVLGNGKYALNAELGAADYTADKEYYSYVYYEDSKPIYRHVAYNKELCGLSFSLSEGGNGFYHYADSLFAVFPFNDTIYSVNKQSGFLSPYLSIKIGDEKIKIDDSKLRIKELRDGGISTSVFSFYKLGDLTLFSYYFNNKNRKYTIVDGRGSILFNGAFGLDENKIPVRVVPYDCDVAHEELLSLSYPQELLAMAKRYSDQSDFLKEIAGKISEEDNPVLIFYNVK